MNGVGGGLATRVRSDIDAASIAFGHNGHQLRPHPSCERFRIDVFRIDGRARDQASEIGSAREFRAGFGAVRRSAFPNFKMIGVALNDRLDEHLSAGLARHDEGRCERNIHVSVRRVRAFDGPSPQPRNDSGLAAAEICGKLDVRVKVGQANRGLAVNPGAVSPDVLREPRCARPILREIRLPAAFARGPDRRPPSESRRNLDHCLVDQGRNGVEVGGEAGQPQTLGFQGDRPAAGEGVVQFRQAIGVEELLGFRVVAIQFAGFPPAVDYLLPGLPKHVFVGGVLPLDQLAHDLEEALAFNLRLFLVHPAAKRALVAGVVHHLSENDRTCGRQRTSRPPQMEGRGVPVPHRLLVHGGQIDIV
ncbi:conserved hypothetical protein [Ricinus communis]|uniref:Uncharacterized protein n=1 Tax=Ricinus communis TaxID=3988 RepID=B9T8R7_RICCO|nr:conserved hypothetical protein [Ricinus communis]